MNEDDRILVGVDGSDAGRAAIRYAAEEARRRDAVLWLAHVVPDYAPTATTYSVDYPVPTVASHRVGRAILADAEQEAGRLVDPARVKSVLLTGYRVPALVRAATHARLVVLGDEPRPILERIATASVLAGVAAHAPVPVVAVPASWSPAPGRPRVVVGVKDSSKAAGLIRRALEAAADRKAELVVLNAWDLPAAYGAPVIDVDPDDWDRRVRDALQQVLRGLPQPATGVDVRIEIRHGQAARMLVEASREADLLLVARRPHGFPFGHLGGTGRAVLRASHCPVEVMPPAAETVGPDDLTLEREDALADTSTASSMGATY